MNPNYLNTQINEILENSSLMPHLLDTNICIYIIKQKPEKVISKIKTLSINDIGISSITVAQIRIWCL